MLELTLNGIKQKHTAIPQAIKILTPIAPYQFLVTNSSVASQIFHSTQQGMRKEFMKQSNNIILHIKLLNGS